MEINEAPVKRDDVVKLKIESIGRKGDGIGRYNGFVVLVPNTSQGNEYNIRITDVHRKFAFGIIEEEV